MYKCTYSDWWNLWFYRAPYRGTAFTKHSVARDPEAVWSWIRDLLFGVWSKWKSSGLCLQGTFKYINDVHNFIYLNLIKTDEVELLMISYYSLTSEIRGTLVFCTVCQSLILSLLHFPDFFRYGLADFFQTIRVAL